MKILYVNFINEVWGHKRLDENIIEYLATFADVTVISPIDWYSNLPNNVRVIQYTLKSKSKKNSKKVYHYSLEIMKFASKIDKKVKFDYIFAATFHTYVQALGRFLFKNLNRIYLMHHYNTDTLERKKSNFFFSLYVNKVNHIVFEKFIGDYLMEKYGLKKERILILPHPLYKNTIENISPKFACVGISNSNDENFIKEIIMIEKKQKIIKENKIHVILRSKTQTFDNGYLKVFTGYLEQKDYNYLINNTRSIFMPFPQSFKHRMSGTLMDALSNGKILLGTDVPLLKLYQKKYPHICNVVKSPNEFINEVINISDFNLNDIKHEFNLFEIDHSSKKIIKILKNTFIEHH